MIFLSAGHYPAKPGARHDRFVEHDEAVVWVGILSDMVENAVEVPVGFLREKTDFINSRIMNGDVAIEIHFNSAKVEGKHVGRGSETLYYPGSVNGEKLAQVCQNALAGVYPPSRGVKEGYYQMNPDKGPDFFLAKTKCPAVIIEPEFVHRADIIHERRDAAIRALADALNEMQGGHSDGDD